jgi:eukaryotic-like serine/threonine-protein kinase
VEGATLAAVCDRLHAHTHSASEVDLETWRSSLSVACAESRRSEKPLSDSGTDGLAPGARQARASSAPVPADRDYVRQVVELVRQVALAADALHAAGVVHRDIKPGNIMVSSDGTQAVLMDLGLAQLADDVEGRLTRTRQFVGTLRYASPEQVLSVGGIDRRSDVYSLGATLWELLTLRPLYEASEEMATPELMRRITSSEPGRVRKHHPSVATDLEAIVQKCLEKEPARRYATAVELAEDLRRWQRGELVTAQPLTTRYVLEKFVRRHRWALVAAALAMLVLVGGLAAEFRRIRQARDEAVALRKEAEEKRLEAVRNRQKAEAARRLAEQQAGIAWANAAEAER